MSVKVNKLDVERVRRKRHNEREEESKGKRDDPMDVNYIESRGCKCTFYMDNLFLVHCRVFAKTHIHRLVIKAIDVVFEKNIKKQTEK